MQDVTCTTTGRSGRITLRRPHALNALTHDMCLAIETALNAWSDDPDVALVVIDAEGEKAFCAGGDVAELYRTGVAKNFEYGRRFWADEYRLNAAIFAYPKPVVSFLQGFTMGGGVGIGCHGTHRIVGQSSRVAMPECGIGLIPDVGGSLMLALAPGRIGEYLGVTGYRMDAADAIFAGFADHFIAEAAWPELVAALKAGEDPAILERAAGDPGPSRLAELQPDIDRLFGGETLRDIRNALRHDGGSFATEAERMMERNAPLSMAATIEVIHRLRGKTLTMEKALDLEYRFTARAMEHGDFLEGIRAAIIDKDRTPAWQYADGNVPAVAVSRMLMPLGADALTLEKTS